MISEIKKCMVGSMFESFIKKASEYFNQEEMKLIIKSYHYAEKAHMGKVRASGEPYFIHPEHVAYYLMDKCHLLDAASVCAALLHDTIEDTDTTWEELKNTFNEEIANLVLGVTNCNTISFKNKTEAEKHNNGLVLLSLLKDIREAYIKISDRLHNMQTLEYKNQKKRYSKAIQTYIFYVPLAYGIKATEAAKELEDLCFKYIFPEDYIHTENIKRNFERVYIDQLNELTEKLEKILSEMKIPFTLDIHMKNLYGIYRGLIEFHRLYKIEDFITIKVIVDSEEDCYHVLSKLRENYQCEEDSIEDNLVTTQLDGYQAITLTMKGFKKYKVKVEIFTRGMEEFNRYGYAVMINKAKGHSFEEVQQMISTHSSFLSAIQEMQQQYQDNNQLVEELESRFLKQNIRVITPENEIIILPEGATVLDFAYRIHQNIGATAAGAYVNGEVVDVNFILKDQDRVEVFRDPAVKRTREEMSLVRTNNAKRRITEFLKNEIPRN